MWTLSFPRTALLGPDKVKITVSLPSTETSSIISAMVMVPLVAPEVIVKVPSAKV